MKIRDYAMILFGVLIIVLGSGCVFHTDLKLLDSKIDTYLKPLKLDHEGSISLGSISMFFARRIYDLCEDDDQTMDTLKSIDRLNVAIYKTHSGLETLTTDCVDQVVRNFTKDGWELFIKVRDKEELALLFYKQGRRDITSFSAVALSDAEVVLLELEGDLKKLIQTSVQERGLCLNTLVKTAHS
ncbi:DUF4252 domain-containing protein [bacterium]|nr:DUF4252 domain-containing protein [bacterium]